MGTIKDEAKEYQPKQMKNISEMEVVRTDLEVTNETFGEGDDKFTAKVTVINGEKYRVPISVLRSLKTILEIKPDLKTFQVRKSGTGMNTEYTVIPIE